MGISDRKKQEKELLRKKILDAAGNIILSEGFDKLSIRKIADQIEYSPAVIYNYFKDKAEIVAFIIQQNSSKIINMLRQIDFDEEIPENTLRKALREYINLVLDSPQFYRAVIMSDAAMENQSSGMMYKGVSQEKETINQLKKTIEAGVHNGHFRQGDGEVFAQIIWASTYGLLSRLILEKQIGEEQRQKLIQAHIDFIVNGLRNGGDVSE